MTGVCTCARRMGASFGSGVAYSLASGAPNPLQAAVTTGMAFAVFNGLFYQVGAGHMRWQASMMQQLFRAAAYR